MNNGALLSLGLVATLTVGSFARGGSAALSRHETEVRLRRRVAREARERIRFNGVPLPAPTTFLDSGMQGGYVFDTTSKGIVVRVGPEDKAESEEALVDLAETGGVVSVLGLTVVDGFVVTWKERVNEFVEGFLHRRYPDPDTFASIWMALSCANRYSGCQHKALATLQRFPETKGLARALREGLPSDDIDSTHNLGVTADGRVVAFDV